MRSLSISTRFALWGLCLFALQAGYHAWDLSAPGAADRSGRLKFPDYVQFHSYGVLAREGRLGEIYRPAAHDEAIALSAPDVSLSGFRPNYSPLIAVLMAPLAGLPYWVAVSVLSALTVLGYGLALRVLAPAAPRAVGLGAALWLVAAAWPALFMVIRYGQLSALTLAILALAARLGRWSPIAGGAMLGLLVYKPNLLVGAAAVLVLARAWTVLAGLLAGAIVELAASTAIAGTVVMQEYITVLLQMARSPEIVQMYPAESHSLRGFAALLSSSRTVVQLVTWLGIPAAALAGALVWRNTVDHRMRWAALVLAFLLASPHLLTYDLLLLAVPLVLALDWVLEPARPLSPTPWKVAFLLAYAGAWPGTMLARGFALQISTIGMALMLLLLARESPWRWTTARSYLACGHPFAEKKRSR